MSRIKRREFLAMAVVLGATAGWARAAPKRSSVIADERRDLYPEGVASGDPDEHSVLLWTRRPFAHRSSACLRVEVADDAAFSRVIVDTTTTVWAASDWTCRVLVGNLKSSRVYWYRFIDDEGHASRVGRTLTAPGDRDERTVRFAFVSCQTANEGWLHAYRRMIYEDERAPATERLEFVLHLGDFIYEIMFYPEEYPKGLNGRRIHELVRYTNGDTILDGEARAFHIPTSLNDYRGVYRAYLHDPDLQNARARWPFICIWDNHEFSMNGFQSIQVFHGQSRAVQTRKVAANQAWFEYQPARVAKSSGPSLEQFRAPEVSDTPVDQFDEQGLGIETNNLAALASLIGYRALRWGRHVELILTDQHSYRSEDFTNRREFDALSSEDLPFLVPQDAVEILDAGRAYANGKPPSTLRIASREIPNFRKDDPSQTILGGRQKAWFLNTLTASLATWKIWGNSIGTLEGRVDAQNLPHDATKPRTGSGYGLILTGDYSTAYCERAELYAAIRESKIAGFVTLSGNSHSFWAGLAAPSLPPKAFEPVGIAFVGAGISSAGLVEALEHSLATDHPLRALYLVQRSAEAPAEPTVNLLTMHGVRACLEYQHTGDLARARMQSNRDLAPHLSFLDWGGHGYATVRASSDAIECEFVCIPRPVEQVTAPDGGPILYRVVHRAPLWGRGRRPTLERRVLEGNPEFSL